MKTIHPVVLTSMIAVLTIVSMAQEGRIANVQYGAAAVPILEYSMPQGFFKISGYGSPEVYASSETNAYVGVYQFRPYTGNLEAAWQQSLLRGWIDPMYQETGLAGQPMLNETSMTDRSRVLFARFDDGLGKAHFRILIDSGGAAAIIDISAATPSALQRIAPAMDTLFQSITIDAGNAGPSYSDASPQSRAMSGTYQGVKAYYNTNLFGSTSSGYYTQRPHFYLLSADGSVYRTFDIVMVERTTAAGFDYRSAAVNDPENSGRYQVQGNRLVMQFNHGRQTEMATIDSSSSFTVNDVSYSRR